MSEHLETEVIHAFIALTETIAHSKTNIMVFGSEDMTFYRGEIHINKMIGDYPGIYSSEIARKFGIARAVVHKTLIKLECRGLVIRHADEEDRKRHKLYLTDKGQRACACHEEYHNTYDRALFDYIDDLSEDELQAIKHFLNLARGLIKNHV